MIAKSRVPVIPHTITDRYLLKKTEYRRSSLGCSCKLPRKTRRLSFAITPQSAVLPSPRNRGQEFLPTIYNYNLFSRIHLNKPNHSRENFSSRRSPINAEFTYDHSFLNTPIIKSEPTPNRTTFSERCDCQFNASLLPPSLSLGRHRTFLHFRAWQTDHSRPTIRTAW
jgi:hypothetical protein